MNACAASARRSIVVCIGNSLVGDDGAGCAVYEALESRRLPEGAVVRCLATGGIALVDELDGQDLLVVVDAVQFGAPPGTVHVLPWPQLPGDGAAAVSAHGIGVREAVEVTRRLYPERAPRAAVLVGIEGRSFDRLGDGLSPEVAAGVPEAAARVLELLTGGPS